MSYRKLKVIAFVVNAYTTRKRHIYEQFANIPVSRVRTHFTWRFTLILECKKKFLFKCEVFALFILNSSLSQEYLSGIRGNRWWIKIWNGNFNMYIQLKICIEITCSEIAHIDNQWKNDKLYIVQVNLYTGSSHIFIETGYHIPMIAIN